MAIVLLCENTLPCMITYCYNTELHIIYGAQQYRALFTISQDTEHDFYDAIPMPYLMYLSETSQVSLLCFFNARKFYLTCLSSFFYMLCSILYKKNDVMY